MPRTHYDNLQVSRTASDRVIRASYKSLSQEWHPDKHPQDTDRAEKITKIINQAYKALSDPQLRKEHDEWVAGEEKKEALRNNNEAQSHGTHDKHVDAYSRHRSTKPKKRTAQNETLDAIIRKREERIRSALYEKLGREPSFDEIERAKWDGMCLDD
jgi:curved DNA-binding protein CbpA